MKTYKGKNYYQVPVAGILTTGQKKYYLTRPTPISNFDSWIRDERVFTGVPKDEYETEQTDTKSNYLFVYERAIIVSGTWHIEYLSDKFIWVERMDEILSETVPSNYEITDEEWNDLFPSIVRIEEIKAGVN